jgi:L-2-hydroxyglutarate oxidase LhgO
MEVNEKDIAIVGGGFYGLYIAEYMAKLGKRVVLFEKNTALMQRASLVNQARVHNGYHYPRSVLTALKSRVSFPRFVEEFGESILSDFEKLYLIGKPLGHITRSQFIQFCNRIGAEIYPAGFSEYVDDRYIDGIFKVKEYAFDATRLKDLMVKRIAQTNVEILMNTEVIDIESVNEKCLVKVRSNKNLEHEFLCQQTFVCTMNFPTLPKSSDR